MIEKKYLFPMYVVLIIALGFVVYKFYGPLLTKNQTEIDTIRAILNNEPDNKERVSSKQVEFERQHHELIKSKIEELNGGLHRIVEITTVTSKVLSSNVYQYEVDVITTIENMYDWLRIEVFFHNDEIIIMERISIPFYERLQPSNHVSQDVYDFITEALISIPTNSRDNFGINLRGQQIGSKGINGLKVSALESVGQSSINNEYAFIATVEVKLFDNIEERQLLLYLRQYDEKWQIEDLRAMGDI